MVPGAEAIRTCIGCRRRRPKSELLRLVRAGGQAGFDQSGRREGRGAYLCPEYECLEAATKRGAPGRALKINIDGRGQENILSGLKKFINEQKVS